MSSAESPDATAWQKSRTAWQDFRNRFGLLILWLGCAIYWHHSNEAKQSGGDLWLDVSALLGLAPQGPLFIEYFLSITLTGVILGGISGYYSYCAFKPVHHKNHSGAAVLVWGLGVLLVCVTAYLATLLIQASDCMAKVGGDGDANTRWMVDSEVSTCNPTVAAIYTALQPFQTGIGATIGLLGLAWSTMYRSVYENWLEHEPGPAPVTSSEPVLSDKLLSAWMKNLSDEASVTQMKLDALLQRSKTMPNEIG